MSVYARLLHQARCGDPEAGERLRIEARRRGDVRGLAIATLTRPPSAEAWHAIGAALQAGSWEDEILELACERLEPWPDALRAADPAWWAEASWDEAESGAHCPGLKLARGLSWRGVELRGREGWRALTRSDGVEAWTWLEVERAGMGDALVEILVDAERFYALRRLSLVGCDLTPVSVEHLSRSTVFSGLTHLDLRDNALGDEAASMFLDAPWWTLVQVDLRGNPMSQEALRRLRQALPADVLG